MRNVVVDNYIINKPIIDILYTLQRTLTNGKLKDIIVKGENIVVTCPNNNHSGGQESKPACNIYVGNDEKIQYGYHRCFVCEDQGTFLHFVAECFNSSEAFAKDWLIKTFGGELIEKSVFTAEDIVLPSRKKVSHKVLNESILDKFQNWHPYLEKRGLTRATCNQFKVKYDPQYRQIVFPYYNEKNQLITLLKRSIDTKTFYIEKDLPKPLYGINNIIKNNISKCIITEGLFDCLLANQYGFPTIATLGTPSDNQIEIINKSCLKTIYLMMDNDEAGRKFTRTLQAKLNDRFLIIPVQIQNPYKDIGELDKDTFWKFIKIAENN